MSEELSPSGQPIYRHSERRQDASIPLRDEVAIQQIKDHVKKYIGEIDVVFSEIVSDLIYLDILIVKPSKERNFYTLVTCGMSQLPMTVPEGAEGFRFAELLICLPSDWQVSEEAFKQDENYWPILWLKKLARLPHEYQTWLYHGHTVPNGDPAQPYAGNTRLSGMILSIPSVFEELNELFTLVLSEEKRVHFFSLIPLYDEEMDYKLRKGTDGLFSKLEQAGVNEIVNIKRKNVSKKLFGIF